MFRIRCSGVPNATYAEQKGGVVALSRPSVDIRGCVMIEGAICPSGSTGGLQGQPKPEQVALLGDVVCR